jgi:peptide-methionine (R)-S-oxide reductase
MAGNVSRSHEETTMQIQRRHFILGAGALALGASALALFRAPAVTADGAFEVTKTDAEWKALLKPDAYAVLRQANTEYPNTSALLKEHRKGTFACAGCDLPLYDSAQKFESGTGWPSFFDHLPNAVATKADNGLLTKRTEVHCRRCGGHLGHVFEDGPKPTGLRYCMNGVSLTFHPAEGA